MKTLAMGAAQVCRYVLATIFILAALTKLADLASFASAVRSFHLIPGFALDAVSIVAPVLELEAGLLLISERWCRQGALLGSALSIVFTILFVWESVQGNQISCGCFGQFFQTNFPTIGTVRSVGLFLMNGLVYFTNLANVIRVGKSVSRE